MKVGPNKSVTFDYQLYNEDGVVIDCSEEGNPLRFVFGEGSIIPGLERQMEGMEAGESREVTVQPEEAYGPKNPNLIQHVPRTQFDEISILEVGMSYRGKTDDGATIDFAVIGMDEENVELDLNHPLAGKILRFQITIVDVQEAGP